MRLGSESGPECNCLRNLRFVTPSLNLKGNGLGQNPGPRDQLGG